VNNAKCSGIGIFQLPVAPQITAQPADQTVFLGGSASFNVQLSGDPEWAFLWMKNEEELSGQIGDTLMISNAQSSDAGAYFVLAYNRAGTAISSNAYLSVVLHSAALDCSFSNGLFRVSWPGSEAGWVLQYSSNLMSGNVWQDIPGDSITNNAFYLDPDQRPWESAFFRLLFP
jgi:hypothetical protein